MSKRTTMNAGTTKGAHRLRFGWGELIGIHYEARCKRCLQKCVRSRLRVRAHLGGVIFTLTLQSAEGAAPLFA